MIKKISKQFKRSIDVYEKYGFVELASRCYKMLNHPLFRDIKYTIQYSEGVAPMYETITVNPDDVDYLVIPRFQRILHNRGYHIRGGEWDTQIINQTLMFHADHNDSIKERGLLPFDNFNLYNSLEDRFINGCDWEDTAYYDWEIKMCEKGLRKGSESAIKSGCERIDKLFKSVQKNGYQTQRDLSESVAYPNRHEVMVNIGRHGGIFLDDGRHRLCIAKILNIDSIPVKVLVRHKKWQQIRAKAAQDGTESIDERYKGHPDLSDISLSG